jgi:HD-GYP domain-containing protein (c-di-GMP phosphodiesterase class II)
LHHHERWDGSGYPSGLSGEEIPINCRILAIVDAYDAMTNDRVYRRGKAPELAMEELLFNSGNQFDPTLVRIFIDKVYQE